MKTLSLTLLICLNLLCPLSAQDEQPALKEVTNIEQLIEILKADNIDHQANVEQQFVMVPINRSGMNSAQVIRWAAQDGVVHFIQVIPLQVPKEHAAAVESAMIRLNHSFPVPGLGMNPENNTPYFRLSVPIQPRGFLQENEIKDYFNFCVGQGVQFAPTLAAIANGEITASASLDYHRKRMQAAFGPIGAWKKKYAESEWIMTINPKGEVTLRRDGEVVVDSMVTVEDGKRMIFDDVTGPLAVEGKGIYEFKIEGETMTFTAVEDPGEGRKQVLSDGPWSR